MKNRSWKAAETRMARDVGTERKPCDGSRDGADFTDGIACYQLKVRKSLPAWLWTWLGGIVDTAARDGKIGALVLRTPRMQDREALVMVRWEDWVALHGDARKCCRHEPELHRNGVCQVALCECKGRAA